MHIYWTLRTVPGLEDMPTRERWSVFREATEKHVGEGRRMLYVVPAVLAAGLGAWLGYGLANGSFVGVLLGALGAWVGGVIGNSLLIRRVSPYLAEVVAARSRQAPRLDG